MPEEQREAIEAQEGETADEAAHYECAFHILPTVAEVEVPAVVEDIKTLITRFGGTVTSEEAPEQYDLAYEITKQIDGSNRRFNAAYFGWVRFEISPAGLLTYVEELKQKPEILRYLIIRLTREEMLKPFSLFEMRRAQAQLDADAAASKREARGEVENEVAEEVVAESVPKVAAE